MARTSAIELEADGRTVKVSNPERIIFEACEYGPEITKLEVVQYYIKIADAIVPALRERPTALERWPKGVRQHMTLSGGRGTEHADAFYQKRPMRGMPEWARTVPVLFPSGRSADELCPDHVAVVAWAAQMGAITFHPWPVRRRDTDRPDELRIDLDPHGSTDYTDAITAALAVRDLLAELGIRGYAKTSGKNGVHVYVRIIPAWTFTDVRHAAIALGRELERRITGVITNWWKEQRGDNVFIDFNQNCRDRTVASAYSLRPRPGAPVSMPLDWEHLAEKPDPMDFTLRTVPDLLAERGDAWSRIDAEPQSLGPLLELWRADCARGLGDLPYPPDYPKMPGEPKRVQPSKDADQP